MIGILRPLPTTPRLPEQEAEELYQKLRWQIFIGIFVGYAGYYLVRRNFSLAIPHLIENYGYTRGELGLALSAIAIAYGLSKFLMGNVSDRSNPKIFLPLGLALSSGIMFLFGFSEWATSSVALMFCLLFFNGWFQGMGWPACGRTMVHWWSHKERGRIVSTWNVAHNIGGGLIGPLFILGFAWTNDWRAVFYVPAAVACGIAIFAFLSLKDTPQSCGLPSIEEKQNDFPEGYGDITEKELSGRDIFFTYIFPNKVLWYLAIANVFIYLIRYGVLDWAPLYLKEVKDFTVNESSWAYFFYEWAGIPGTLLCGWMSDRYFKARRAPAGILFMILVTLAILIYWLNPPGNPGVDIAALMAIGFLIYGPVMLVGLFALELVPKKAAGTAAGLTGLFGYLGGTVIANAVLGYTVDFFGWNGGFLLIFLACLLSILFLAMAMNVEKRTTT